MPHAKMLKVLPNMFAVKNKKLVIGVGTTYGRVDFNTYPTKVSTKHFLVEAYEPNSLTIKHIGKQPGRVVNTATEGKTTEVSTGSTVVLTPDDVYYPVNHPEFHLRVKLDSVKVKVERTEKAFSIDEVRYFLVNGVIHSARREKRANLMFMAKCLRDVPFTEEELNELVIDEWMGAPQDYLNMLNDEVLEKELGLQKKDVKLLIETRDQCENVNTRLESKELDDFYNTPFGRVELTPAMEAFRIADEKRILKKLSAAVLFQFRGLKELLGETAEETAEEAEDAVGEDIQNENDDDDVEEEETAADKSFVAGDDQLVYYENPKPTKEHGETTTSIVLISKRFTENEITETILEAPEPILNDDWVEFSDEGSDPGSPVLPTKRACRQPSPKPEAPTTTEIVDDGEWL